MASDKKMTHSKALFLKFIGQIIKPFRLEGLGL